MGRVEEERCRLWYQRSSAPLPFHDCGGNQGLPPKCAKKPDSLPSDVSAKYFVTFAKCQMSDVGVISRRPASFESLILQAPATIDHLRQFPMANGDIRRGKLSSGNRVVQAVSSFTQGGGVERENMEIGAFLSRYDCSCYPCCCRTCQIESHVGFKIDRVSIHEHSWLHCLPSASLPGWVGIGVFRRCSHATDCGIEIHRNNYLHGNNWNLFDWVCTLVSIIYHSGSGGNVDEPHKEARTERRTNRTPCTALKTYLWSSG